MPRYFLHIQDGADLPEDPDGAEYHDVAAAEREAVQDARHLMAECLRWGNPPQAAREMLICDARGIILSSMAFADAIPPDDPQRIRKH
jgi:hypothetical protein